MKLLAVLVVFMVALILIALTPMWALAAPSSDASSSRTLPSPRQVEQRILAAFGADRGPRAVRIARCESHTPRRPLNPQAVGAAGELGLFQIHPGHWSGPRPWTPWIAAIVRRAGSARRALFDVATNLLIAYRMSGGGRYWSPWTCSRLVG